MLEKHRCGSAAVNDAQVSQLLGGPAPWMASDGPSADLVISSRIRLARNFAKAPFPHRASANQRTAVVVGVLATLAGAMPTASLRMEELTVRARAILVEKFYISPDFAQQRVAGAALALIGGDRSVMINEEDHLRIQALGGGLSLDSALALANHIDDAIEAQMDYAYDERLGYLTACPTNLGTGLRASTMVHLPALVFSGAIRTVVAQLEQAGAMIRGIYGENSSPLGAIFQISNRTTLGRTEDEFIAMVRGLTESVVILEREARYAIVHQAPDAITDRIWRAFGALKTARLLPYGEAVEALSLIRWGVHAGILPPVPRVRLNELLYQMGPATLDARVTSSEADHSRATLVREAFEAY